MDNERDERGFSAEGAVVEILERGGERFAKILIEPGTVLELPAASSDLSLGDRVIVDGSLNIERVRGGPDPARILLPSGPAASGAPDEPARPVFRDYEHVLRMAGLFALGIVVFLAWRSWMVPDDFGVYGHYRAGAIADAAIRTPGYAGQASCVECHDDVQQVQLADKHATVSCEACHGPLGRHARSETDVAPIRPSPRAVCLTCHTAVTGMPATFPKVIVNEHSDAGPCTECHKAHAPGGS
jgi:hypothetical protein